MRYPILAFPLLAAVCLGLSFLGDALRPPPLHAQTLTVMSCDDALPGGVTLASLGLCADPTHFARLTTGPRDFLRAVIEQDADAVNYQTQVPCGAARNVDDAGVLVVAGPGDGTCTQTLADTCEDDGCLVPNPQSRVAVGLRIERRDQRTAWVERRARLAAEAAEEAERTQAETELPP